MHKLVEIAKGARTRFTELQLASVVSKDVQDYVTNVDHNLEQFVHLSLKSCWPDIPILSEEDPESWMIDSDEYWVVDPLDGTLNYIAGIHYFGLSIARIRHEETVQACVINFANGELFAAEAGSGAEFEGTEIANVDRSIEIVGVSSGAMDLMVEHDALYKELRKLGKIRNLGAQALHLCYVATGRFKGNMSQEARFWDDAAGRLIACEAGAIYKPLFTEGLKDFSKPLGSICGSPEFVSAVKDHFSLGVR
ncbi:MAG: inositol monophosphatase [Kordiimonas sp.]